MRLDLFLKASRLVIRRSVAKEMCDAGKICVNEMPARSSKEVKVGDLIQIRRGDRLSVHRVEALPQSKQTPKADASALTAFVSETRIDDGLIP